MYALCHRLKRPCWTEISKHRLLTTRFQRRLSGSLSVCIHVCLSDDNFRKPWRGKFFYFRTSVYFEENTGQVCIWRLSGQAQNYRNKKCRKFLFAQCKTSIGNNSGSKAMTFAWSMGFWAIVDQMVWPPSLSLDRKWPRVTICRHSRVVGLRL